MRRAVSLLPVVTLLVPLLAGCSGNDVPDWVAQSPDRAASVPVPGAYRGSDPTNPGVSNVRSQEPQPEGPTQAQLQAALEQRRREADALWARATEPNCNLETQADLFETIADDYPEYPRAAEARFRQGRALYQAREYTDSINALQLYMEAAPVNEHTAEVVEMIYGASKAYVERSKGIFGIFQNDDEGLNGMRYVAVTFPASDYADDALFYLAEYYRRDDELATAVLFYKELLIRYPDSEWTFKARRGMAQAYVARDQGAEYHAGFVDRDPRESVPDDPKAEAHAGPVKSSLELAIEQYDLFLERIERDPGRRAEYMVECKQVEQLRAEALEKLACKDMEIANWYASKGDQNAAMIYRRSAMARRGQPVKSVVPDVKAPPGPSPAPAVVPPGDAPVVIPPQPPRPTQPLPTRPPAPPPPPQPSMPIAPTPAPAPPAPPSSPITGTTSQPQPPAGRPAVPPPPPPPNWR